MNSGFQNLAISISQDFKIPGGSRFLISRNFRISSSQRLKFILGDAAMIEELERAWDEFRELKEKKQENKKDIKKER